MGRVRTLARRLLGPRPLAPAPSPIPTSDDPEVLLPGLYERTITLGHCRWRWGHLYNDQALVFLCHLAAYRTGPIVEFGTFDGRTTYNLALNLPVGGEVVTIDAGVVHDPSNVEGKAYGSFIPGECFLGAPADVRSRIRFIQADSRQVDLSDSHGRAGLVIVDGGHAHDVCVNGTVLALRLVRPGGVIVWDDYTPYWPGVKETLDALVRLVPLTHYPRMGLVVYADRRPGTASADPAAAARALLSHVAPSAEGRIRDG